MASCHVCNFLCAIFQCVQQDELSLNADEDVIADSLLCTIEYCTMSFTPLVQVTADSRLRPDVRCLLEILIS